VAIKVNNSNKPNSSGYGQTIDATIPMIREPIPIIILFRALGVTNDLEIFKRVNPNKNKEEISEILKPSIEESLDIISQEQALDYIAKRGSGAQYARD